MSPGGRQALGRRGVMSMVWVDLELARQAHGMRKRSRCVTQSINTPASVQWQSDATLLRQSPVVRANRLLTVARIRSDDTASLDPQPREARAPWTSMALSQPGTVPARCQARTVADEVVGPGVGVRHVRTVEVRIDGATRAITRAITPGQWGVVTVTRGRSTEGTTARQGDKTAGQRLLTCGLGGGQGRGRTADLPIFSPSLVLHPHRGQIPPSHALGDRRQESPARGRLLALVDA
jgi:hypothetical protein